MSIALVALTLLAGVKAALGPKALAPGVPVTARLNPHGADEYEITLAPGDFLRVVVEQNHLDARIDLSGPDGATLGERDNAVDREDPISLSFISGSGGRYRLRVGLRDRKSGPGAYTIVAETPHPASDADEKRIAAECLRTEADALRLRGSAEASRTAVELDEKSITLFREIGDRAEEAASLSRETDTMGALGDLRETLTRAEEALDMWRLSGNRRGEAAALDRLGIGYGEAGEQRTALALLEEALAMRRRDADVPGLAETYNNIAVARASLGEYEAAIEGYTEAIRCAKSVGNRSAEATMVKNRAVNYAVLGESERAETDLNDALGRFRALGDRRQEAVTEYSLGNVWLDRGDTAAALRHYERARPVLHEVGDRRTEAVAVNHIGLARLLAGDAEAALRDFETARDLFHASGDRRREASVRVNVGRALLDRGKIAEGRRELSEALAQIRTTADRGNEATALVHLARADREVGDLESARGHLEAALRLTESVRGSIPALGERASYLAKTRDRYELLIDVLMDLDGKNPGHGWDAAALQASERAKARSLIDLLAEARVDLRRGVDESLLAEERTLDVRIEAARRDEEQSLAPGAPPRKEGASLDALLAGYEDVEGRLRSANPRFAALARPRPMGLDEIRREVLDTDTVLVEYALGERRSFVWAATSDGLCARVLPPRSVVESAVRALYDVWSGKAPSEDRADAERRARALARMVLDPIADCLGRRRIAIVADGALLYVPFSALPVPGGDAKHDLLVDRHEIAMLPSATTLPILRREAADRPAADGRVAVLADPVFDRSDPRVRGGTHAGQPGREGDELVRSLEDGGIARLPRLPGSRREADAIAELAGPGGAVAALDFRASRATALGDEVSRARIVHFASHGLVDERHPELSGIVLSLVDPDGRPVDGFLQTRDIYRLRMSADLVVLSACRTALGKEVRGEGLLGLARGFMYAGAPRVVASLWTVPDRATEELMRLFYRAMLVDGHSPSVALAEAQRRLRRDPLRASPRFWAAFTLQGDWN